MGHNCILKSICKAVTTSCTCQKLSCKHLHCVLLKGSNPNPLDYCVGITVPQVLILYNILILGRRVIVDGNSNT